MKFSRKNEPDTAPSVGAVPTGADVSTASDSSASASTARDDSTTPSAASGERPAAPETAPKTSAEERPAAPETAPSSPEPQAGLTGKGRVRRTRVSALWIGVVIAAILAVFLLIFIAQNSDDVTISFLGWEGQIPLAVAMLLAAVVAVLIVVVPGSLRIGQLRRALRKNAHS